MNSVSAVNSQPQVIALFKDGSQTFQIMAGATFAELAAQVERLGFQHRGSAIALQVRFAGPSTMGAPDEHGDRHPSH